MQRADDMTAKFRGEMGLADERATYGVDGAMVRSAPATRGLQLEDVDQLLHSHEQRAFFEGHAAGHNEAWQAQQRQREVELGQYVGGAFSLVETEVLAAIVGAAAKARDSNRSTKADIVQAVIDRVKREAAALNDMAHRARTGELFS